MPAKTTVASTETLVTPAQDTKPGLFVSIKTFNAEGRTIGERIVDMYHYGTRNWLQNHHWWAMHNGHCVETTVATQAEIDAYMDASKAALAAKFNGSPDTTPEAAPVKATKKAA